MIASDLTADDLGRTIAYRMGRERIRGVLTGVHHRVDGTTVWTKRDRGTSTGLLDADHPIELVQGEKP